MKKKISRIWGVGLTLMMVVSLLLWAAPVAADTLEWDTEDEPEDFEAIDITDMVVSAGGLAIYVVAGTDTMYVSSDTGESWEEATILDDILLDATLVAVAPDDPQYVAAAGTLDSTTNATVYITEDSGATWDSLGPVNETDPATFTVMDVAVSMESGDNRFIAVAGVGAGTENASVWYYEVGALGAEWTEITTTGYDGWTDDRDVAAAVAFSPNFNSDQILLVVTHIDGDVSWLEVFSFNTETWNTDVGGFSDDYPLDLDVEAVTGGAPTLVAADIAPSPDYLGSDDDLRQVFIGLAHGVSATDAEDYDGIFFADDDDVEYVEKSELIHSVDFDGTNLVAGSHNGTTVFRSDDPLEGEDADVDTSSSSKSPGGESDCVVAFADGVVVAGSVGDDSAFSVSGDMGDNFNDITLIDGEIAVDGMLDFAVSADGSVKYLLTVDNISVEDDVSLWRLDNDLWERVRLFNDYDENYGDNLANLVIRIAPDDPDAIYLVEVGLASTIFYSSDGGQSTWHNRTSRYPIKDMAVETDGGIAYVLTENGYVSKSVNTGFTWGSKETTGQSGDNMIISLGEDMLLVGGNANTDAVSYSTDGNESWTDLDPIDEGGNVQVTATGLADGDFIYAATAVGSEGKIYRWELGEDDEWDDDLGELPEAHAARGIGLAGGILYVLSDNGSESSMLTRFLDPSGDDEGDQSEATAPAGVFFDRTPTALRISIGSANMWAVDTAAAKFYNYEDTVALIGPTLKSPSSGTDIPMNEISGYPADVNLVWESPSDEVTEFEIEIALDADFDEGWEDLTKTKSSGSWDEEDAINEVWEGDGLVPEETYYWRVKVSAPVESPWSETWSFTVEAAEGVPPVTVEIPPTPEVTVTVPAPQVTVTVPPVVTVPPAPAPAAGWALITIIVIGALLVIALIVLILRTRRVV